MKKIIFILTCLLILPLMVSAQEYTIKELDLKLDIPDNYLVITRDNYQDLKELEELGVDQEYMADFFFSLSAYLDAYDQETKKEFFLVALNTTDKNTNDFTEEDIEIFKKELMENLPQYVKTEDDVEELTINDLKYFSIGYLDTGYETYVQDYYYVYQNIVYVFKVQSSKEFTEDDLKEFESILETVKYSDDKITITEVDVSKPTEENKEEKDFSINTNIVIIGVLIVAIIALLIGLVFKIKKLKEKK